MAHHQNNPLQQNNEIKQQIIDALVNTNQFWAGNDDAVRTARQNINDDVYQAIRQILLLRQNDIDRVRAVYRAMHYSQNVLGIRANIASMNKRDILDLSGLQQQECVALQGEAIGQENLDEVMARLAGGVFFRLRKRLTLVEVLRLQMNYWP